MAKIRPYKGTSPQRLVALINQENGSDLQLGIDLSFGPPAPWVDEQARNTKISAIPSPTSIYKKPQDVFYWRLNLRVLDNLPDGVVEKVVIPGFPFSIHSILPAINAALGLDLRPEEVEDTLYETEQALYSLTIKADVSEAWIGDFEFETRLEGTPQPLSEIIVVRLLNGLNYTPQEEIS